MVTIRPKNSIKNRVVTLINRKFIDAANTCQDIDKNLPPAIDIRFKGILKMYKCMFNINLFNLARLLLVSPVKGQLLVTANSWQTINSDRRMLL